MGKRLRRLKEGKDLSEETEEKAAWYVFYFTIALQSVSKGK